MSLVVGSARIDENGHISGGKPGDQTGNEVSTPGVLRPFKRLVLSETEEHHGSKRHRRSYGCRDAETTISDIARDIEAM